VNIKPLHNNVDNVAKCNSKPAPRKNTAINHNRNFNTFLRNNHATKPKKDSNAKNNNKLNVTNHYTTQKQFQYQQELKDNVSYT